MIGLFVLSIAAAAPLDVGVLPMRGAAGEVEKTRATKILIDALHGVDGVRAISLEKIGELFGPAARAALDRCEDDACFTEATRGIRTDALIDSRLDLEEGRLRLRMRLIRTSTRSELEPARVTADVSEETGGLIVAVSSGVADLLGARAASGFGFLVLRGDPPEEAELAIDGRLIGWVTGETLRIRAGEHTIAIRAPGHVPQQGTVTIRVGQLARFLVDLDKRHSRSPYVVGGIGVAAGLAGGMLGFIAQSTANDWKDACGSGACAEGFTRARYEEDRSNVDRLRFSANALYVVSALAVTGGVLWYFLEPGVDE